MLRRLGAMIGLASSAKSSLEESISSSGGEFQPHVTHEEKAKKEKSVKARKAAKKARRANRGRR